MAVISATRVNTHTYTEKDTHRDSFRPLIPLSQPAVTVTVTKALVLRPLLEDRGRITESTHILVPVNRIKQKCFQITTKRVCRS